jgi:hypothetical protein
MEKIIRRGEAAEEHKKKITQRRRVRGVAQRKKEKSRFLTALGMTILGWGDSGVGVTARGDVGDNLLSSDAGRCVLNRYKMTKF